MPPISSCCGQRLAQPGGVDPSSQSSLAPAQRVGFQQEWRFHRQRAVQIDSLRQLLSRLDMDNAARADQGVPQWLPLPVTDEGFMRDARMFAWNQDGESAAENGAGSESESFCVVLLLDLTRLGPIRVDVDVRGGQVAATVPSRRCQPTTGVDRRKGRVGGDAGRNLGWSCPSCAGCARPQRGCRLLT